MRQHDGTCLEPDCREPRELSRSGRVYQRCVAHERSHRKMLHERKHGARTDDRLTGLAERMRWPQEVPHDSVDDALAAIATEPRHVPELCGPCWHWHFVTGQYRECRNCRRGRKILAENEAWRTPSRQISDWSIARR